jgi:hypothetical protein
MQKTIVITTINGITSDIEDFLDFSEWNVVLVGDKKTPDVDSSNYERLTYLDVETQRGLGFSLEEKLPYHNYTRKNVGYLYAIESGADWIAETDDDNRPKSDWDEWPTFPTDVDRIDAPQIPNIYKEFTDRHVWPRGYPLDDVLEDKATDATAETLSRDDVGVIQALVDREPDVDAIYRMTVGENRQFESRRPVSLGEGVYSPFNSQNTLWYPQAYMYLYMPVTASHRYLDILRGYVTCKGLAAADQRVLFTEANAIQDRNPHDLMKDFESEVQMYLTVTDVVDILDSMSLSGEPADDLREIYKHLAEASVVEEEELEYVDAWVSDVNDAR